MFSLSQKLYSESSTVFPEGVNSPLRLFSEVETPVLFINSAKGSIVTDVDGNQYVDFINGLGALILGHSHPEIRERVIEQLQKGTMYCCNCLPELELGKAIQSSSDYIENLRFTCSGTEAVMGAIRVARAYTHKEKVVRFSGSYHGHSDLALYRSEKNEQDYLSRGLASPLKSIMLTCPWGDWKALESLLASDNNIAAVIVEPVASNMGLRIPELEFLQNIRRVCTQYSVLLIFDEVVTGFRFCYGSVSNIFGVQPDLVTFGKIIGGGMSIGCFGGLERIMSTIKDNTNYFQGGTFSGNPISMVAGNTTLNILKNTDAYDILEKKGCLFQQVIEKWNESHNGNVILKMERLGSLISIFPHHEDKPLSNWDEVFSKMHLHLVKSGYLLPPSADEPIFISLAHSNDEISGLANKIIGFFKSY